MGDQFGITNPDYDIIRRETGVETEDAVRRLFLEVSSLLSQVGSTVGSPLSRSRCVAHASVAQSIPSALFTILTLDVTDFDALNLHSAIDNSKIIVRVSGLYRLEASIRIPAFVGNAGIAIFVNGVAVRGMVQPCGGLFDDFQTFRTMLLTAGDVVQAQAYQDSGGNLSVGSTFRFAAAELGVFGVS